MTTEEALSEYLVAQNVAEKDDGRKDLYESRWFYAPILGVQVRVFPRFGFQKGLPAHDTHHMLNGYPTNWVGECETAAWELASGGCASHLIYWIDRLFFLAMALVVAPMRSVRAWQRGWGQRNLYRFEPDQLLAMDLAEVRRYVSRASPPMSRPSS
jgi:hypothetical protein